MKLSYELSSGKKSIDRQVLNTVNYVNKHIQENRSGCSEQELARWGKEVIETAIKNIANHCIAYVE